MFWKLTLSENPVNVWAAFCCSGASRFAPVPRGKVKLADARGRPCQQREQRFQQGQMSPRLGGSGLFDCTYIHDITYSDLILWIAVCDEKC